MWLIAICVVAISLVCAEVVVVSAAGLVRKEPRPIEKVEEAPGIHINIAKMAMSIGTDAIVEALVPEPTRSCSQYLHKKNCQENHCGWLRKQRAGALCHACETLPKEA